MKRLSTILTLVAITAVTGWANVPLYNVSSLLDASGVNVSTVAWGDVNADNLPDLFVGDGGATGSMMFLNTGDGFVAATDDYSVQNLTDVISAQFVDYDKDGYLDLTCLTRDAQSLHVLRQTADHRFQEVPMLQGVQGLNPIASCAWTDFDRDGDLDLLLSNHPDIPTMTWLQQNGASFVEVRGESDFPSNEPPAGTICVADFDRDSYLDLFFGRNTDAGPALYRYDHDSMVPWQEEDILPLKCGSTGAAWVDIDNDGYYDLVLPGSENECFLLRYQPAQKSHTFADWTNLPGFRAGCEGGVYVHSADFNMDGRNDLLVVKSGRAEPVIMINNMGSGNGWINQPFDWDNENYPVVIKACALGDFDNDGDMDIAFAEGNHGVRLYRNDTVSQHRWIGFRLLNPETTTPVADCQALMKFDQCRSLGSTSAMASSAGHDQSILYFYEATNSQKPINPRITIKWSNGVVQDYPLNPDCLGEINDLYEPPAPPPALSSIVHQNGSGVHVSNSPNPFNPTTTIAFTLPEASAVNLVVYDLTGRQVAVLANASYSAGNHTVTFDATNLPSGLYIARLAAGSDVQLHRMLLLK